jgi:isopentenyl-diphosphate delta-isomerase
VRGLERSINADNTELVILLDEANKPIGAIEKSAVHTAVTPLHLGFSCHVFNQLGQVLVARRASVKDTWPGVWSNSVCGHPQPGEVLEDSVRRRARYELGLEIERLELVLPDFRYRAVDTSGTVENELCPVYVARAAGTLEPRSDEVSEFVWARPEDLNIAASAAPWAFSPWLVLQLGTFELRAAFQSISRRASDP